MSLWVNEEREREGREGTKKKERRKEDGADANQEQPRGNVRLCGDDCSRRKSVSATQRVSPPWSVCAMLHVAAYHVLRTVQMRPGAGHVGAMRTMHTARMPVIHCMPASPGPPLAAVPSVQLHGALARHNRATAPCVLVSPLHRPPGLFVVCIAHPLCAIIGSAPAASIAAGLCLVSRPTTP